MSMTRIDYVEMPLASEIDGIGGFASPKKLVSWAGMCPTVHQSGNTMYHGRMKEDPNRKVYWVLIQAAHVAVELIRSTPMLMRLTSKPGWQKGIHSPPRTTQSVSCAMRWCASRHMMNLSTYRGSANPYLSASATIDSLSSSLEYVKGQTSFPRQVSVNLALNLSASGK